MPVDASSALPDDDFARVHRRQGNRGDPVRNDLDGEVEGKPVPEILWNDRGVVPILRIYKGLADESDGVELMKPMPDLDALLRRGVAAGNFGAKERFVVEMASTTGIAAIVEQRFDVGAVRVIALSGGYSRDDANAKRAENPAMIASFSRALTEGLTAQQSDEEFNATLDASIESIYQASIEKVEARAYAVGGF